MAQPLRIDQLDAVGTLSGSAALAVVQSGDTYRATPHAIISAGYALNVMDPRFGAVGDGVTDDGAAFNSFYSALSAGGMGIIPPGTYMLGTQPSLLRAYSESPRNLHILGYGATLKTTGAISAFKITADSDGSYPPNLTVIEGVKVDHLSNSNATAGFETVGATHVTYRNCTVLGGSNSSTYKAFYAHNFTASDANTGCFWLTIHGCTVRIDSGGQLIPYAIYLAGACNRAKIVGCSLSPGHQTGANAIYITTESGQTYFPNGVLIDGNALEAAEYGVRCVMNTNPVSGIRVVHNDVETVDTFISFEGGTPSLSVPPSRFRNNWLASDVSTYFNNPQSHYAWQDDTHYLWPDNTYDIGAASATRPRSIYYGTQILGPAGSVSSPSFAKDGTTNTGIYFDSTTSMMMCAGGVNQFRMNGGSAILALRSAARFGWSASDDASAGPDVFLARDAAAALALKNSTTAQEFRHYGSEITAGTRYSRLTIKHATTTLASVSGATVTASNLIPAKANVLGVNTIVTVALGTGGGTTGYAVGDGTDANRWGDVVGTAAGTDTDGNDATADPTGYFNAANNVVITAAGGNFNGTGSIFVDVAYWITEAD